MTCWTICDLTMKELKFDQALANSSARVPGPVLGKACLGLDNALQIYERQRVTVPIIDAPRNPNICCVAQCSTCIHLSSSYCLFPCDSLPNLMHPMGYKCLRARSPFASRPPSTIASPVVTVTVWVAKTSNSAMSIDELATGIMKLQQQESRFLELSQCR